MPYALGPVLSYLGAGRYRTVGPTEYVGEREVIHIPSDFDTDLASVPRIFWALLPPTGVYESAAVAHDWHCVRLAAGDCAISSRDADGLFRRMAREGGAGFVTRWLLWTGVRWGAMFNPHRRPGIAADLPLMLAISTATLAAVVVVVRVLDGVAHAVL